ncbi:hypothetical protein ACWA1F_21765 [Flavobacterium sp. 3-218]
MESIKKNTITNSSSLAINECEIPLWQINQVKKRTEEYLKNPESATDINDFLKEIDVELNQF